MIQVDDNTKQTQLYKNYVELVKFLHNDDLGDVAEHTSDEYWRVYDTLCELKDKNPL